MHTSDEYEALTERLRSWAYEDVEAEVVENRKRYFRTFKMVRKPISDRNYGLSLELASRGANFISYMQAYETRRYSSGKEAAGHVVGRLQYDLWIAQIDCRIAQIHIDSSTEIVNFNFVSDMALGKDSQGLS